MYLILPSTSSSSPPLLNLRRYCHYQFSKQCNPIPFPVFPLFPAYRSYPSITLERRDRWGVEHASAWISFRDSQRPFLNPVLVFLLKLEKPARPASAPSSGGIYLAYVARKNLRELISGSAGSLAGRDIRGRCLALSAVQKISRKFLLPRGSWLVGCEGRFLYYFTHRGIVSWRFVGDVPMAYCRWRIYAILSLFLPAEIRSSMPPMINEKVVYMSARLKDTIVIPCVAYGNPPPRTGKST